MEVFQAKGHFGVGGQSGGKDRWAEKREGPESQMLGSRMDDGALQQTLHKALGVKL